MNVEFTDNELTFIQELLTGCIDNPSTENSKLYVAKSISSKLNTYTQGVKEFKEQLTCTSDTIHKLEPLYNKEYANNADGSEGLEGLLLSAVIEGLNQPVEIN